MRHAAGSGGTLDTTSANINSAMTAALRHPLASSAVLVVLVGFAFVVGWRASHDLRRPYDVRVGAFVTRVFAAGFYTILRIEYETR